MSEPKTTAKAKTDPWASGLVGRCFVHFERDHVVEHQGIVRAKITDTVYLIQYFEAFLGEPSTLELLPLDRLLSDGSNRRKAGSYEFFEDDEHLRFWMEYRYHKPERERATSPTRGDGDAQEDLEVFDAGAEEEEEQPPF